MYEKLIGTKMNDFALVLHRLLPAKSTQPYNLRPRRHSFYRAMHFSEGKVYSEYSEGELELAYSQSLLSNQ